MRMRHAAVVAGLALGSMSGVASAASLGYNINIPLADGSLATGTIDTDGKPGSLSYPDIQAYDLFFEGEEINSAVTGVRNYFNGGSLFAVGNALTFRFDNSGSQVDFDGSPDQGLLRFYAGNDGRDSFYAAFNSDLNGSTTFVPAGTVLTIGVSEGTVMSPVPLPASAPMFGAALVALGAFGYGVKRKKIASAV